MCVCIVIHIYLVRTILLIFPPFTNTYIALTILRFHTWKFLTYIQSVFVICLMKVVQRCSLSMSYMYACIYFISYYFTLYNSLLCSSFHCYFLFYIKWLSVFISCIHNSFSNNYMHLYSSGFQACHFHLFHNNSCTFTSWFGIYVYVYIYVTV